VQVYLEDRGSRFLRNVGSYLRNYKAYHHTRQDLPNHHRWVPISYKSMTCNFTVPQHVCSVQCFIPRNTCVKQKPVWKVRNTLVSCVSRYHEISHGLNKILYSSILRSCLGSCVSVPCYVYSVSRLYVYLLISVYQGSLALRPLGCQLYGVFVLLSQEGAKTFSMKTQKWKNQKYKCTWRWCYIMGRMRQTGWTALFVHRETNVRHRPQ
jgi:hypothetical protein